MVRHPLTPRPLPRGTHPRPERSDEVLTLCRAAQLQALIKRTSAPGCGCLDLDAPKQEGA
jgi:hypothetical protein